MVYLFLQRITPLFQQVDVLHRGAGLVGLNLLVCPLREQRCGALSRLPSLTERSKTNARPKTSSKQEEGSLIHRKPSTSHALGGWGRRVGVLQLYNNLRFMLFVPQASYQVLLICVSYL